MENRFPADRLNMKLFTKKLIIISIISFCLTALFSEDLPNGYRNISLGMSLEETKDNLIKNPEFGYHGDKDVSLVPGTNKILIETDAFAGHSYGFLTRCWFQFFDDQLFIITININPDKMDYYSIFTKLSEKYGNPTTLDPKSATWKNDDVTMTLEKPLSLKYIDNHLFDKTLNYSNIENSPTEITREMFLDEL